MQTRPTTRTGTVKIHPSRGITVNGLHYWHDCMRGAQVAGQTVPVRYEPYDMGVAYAYIGGQWLECVAESGTSRASTCGLGVMPFPRSGSNWSKSANTSANRRQRMEQTEAFNCINQGAL